MSCPTELLPLAAAGTLPPGDATGVRDHVAGCPACRDDLVQWEALAQATQAAESVDPPPVQPPAAPQSSLHPLHAPERLPLGPFRHLAWPKADRYRRILQAFAVARSGFVVHLRPEDVAAALGVPPDEALTQDLDVLAEAGNLRTAPDTSRVTSVEDFTRRRMLYALTREGEAVEAAIGTYAATLSRRAELQAVALEDIRTSLRVLLELARAEAPDAGRTMATLRELETVFAGLADNAAAFMASLTRSIDTAADGVDAFLAYKDRLIGYLQRFIGDLVVASAEIAGDLEALDALGVERLLAVAAQRQATDAAPDGDDAVQGAQAEHLAAWTTRWAGLRRWFLGRSGGPSQAELLRARARTAIADLLETVAALHERRAGRSDRAADFATLARWFAEAPTDEDAHRLWRTAFGLAASRHLTVDGDTLDDRRADPVAASIPWAEAPRVQVSARLRRTGSHQRRGPVRSSDRSAERAQLATRLARERTETAAARGRLALGRAVRLSELALDAETFPLFLRVLGDALAAARPDAATETTTTDGTFLVRLEPVGDGRVAEIRTPEGTLRGPDHVIVLTDLLAAVYA